MSWGSNLFFNRIDSTSLEDDDVGKCKILKVAAAANNVAPGEVDLYLVFCNGDGERSRECFQRRTKHIGVHVERCPYYL